MNADLLAEAQAAFVRELPDLIRIALWSFRHEDAADREDAAWRAVEMCWRDYLTLSEQGRGELLRCCLSYSIRAARAGRDVSQSRRPTDRCEVPWSSLPYELPSPRMLPDAEIELKLDLNAWMDSLRPIDAWLAAELGGGTRTGEVAAELHVTPGRIAQRRTALVQSWREFTGCDDAVPA
jgi:hypothetical protein